MRVRKVAALASSAALGGVLPLMQGAPTAAHSIDITPFGDTGPGNPGAVSWHMFHHPSPHGTTSGIWEVYMDRTTAIPTPICNYTAKIERWFDDVKRSTTTTETRDGCVTVGQPGNPVNREFPHYGTSVNTHNHYSVGTTFFGFWEDQWTNGAFRKVGSHDL